MKKMESEKKYKKHSYQKGEAFGRLILTGRNYLKSMYGQQRRIVEAECMCGTVKWYLFEHLIRENTKSCGCLQRELTSARRTTHGYRKHPIYIVYRGIKERCYNKNHISYPSYGGRGITMCDEWAGDPGKFVDWAIENGWATGLLIDRKENNGNYEPSNCRFIEAKGSSRNRRSARMIEAFGITKSLTEWAKDRRCKVSLKRIWARIAEGGWGSIEEIITIPPTIRGVNKNNRSDNKMITAFGETKSLKQWMKDERCIPDEKRLRLRLRKGWNTEKALSTWQRKLPVI